MTEAERLLAEGLEFERAGDSASAERAYHAAAELSPEWSVPFYNLGLMYKYQHHWCESFEFNKRATTLDPDDEAGWWNFGIAAAPSTEPRHVFAFARLRARRSAEGRFLTRSAPRESRAAPARGTRVPRARQSARATRCA